MELLLLRAIAKVMLGGCGRSEAELALIGVFQEGNKVVQQHLAAWADLNDKAEKVAKLY